MQPENAAVRSALNPPPYKEPAPSKPLSFAEIRLSRPIRFMASWVREAKEEEVAKAWAAFMIEEDPGWRRRLALGLRHRTEPCDVALVIAKALEWRGEGNDYATALERLNDPRVRQLGFDLISQGFIRDGVGVLQKNAEPGDERTVLDAVMPLVDDFDLHCVGLDILGFDKALDRRELLRWVYEETPCSFCRNTAVRQLIESSWASKEILAECMFDCDQDTREMAAEALA